MGAGRCASNNRIYIHIFMLAWKKGGIYPAEHGRHYLVQGELYAFVYDAQHHIRQQDARAAGDCTTFPTSASMVARAFHPCARSRA